MHYEKKLARIAERERKQIVKARRTKLNKAAPALLKAARIGLVYINATVGVPRPIQDFQEDKEQVEQAITQTGSEV